MADNRLFNVNGPLGNGGEKLLLKTLELAFELDGKHASAKGWRFSVDKGLILDSYIPKAGTTTPFPAAMTAELVFPFVHSWLLSEEAKTVKLGRWCDDHDHDGSNSLGWRVYVEDWGHVDSRANGSGGHEALVAISPCFMWHGK
jgi:hypothetical protein